MLVKRSPRIGIEIGNERSHEQGKGHEIHYVGAERGDRWQRRPDYVNNEVIVGRNISCGQYYTLTQYTRSQQLGPARWLTSTCHGTQFFTIQIYNMTLSNIFKLHVCQVILYGL